MPFFDNLPTINVYNKPMTLKHYKFKLGFKLSLFAITFILFFVSSLNASIQTKSIIIMDVTEVYIDDVLMFSFPDNTEVQTAINAYMQSYLTQVDPNAKVISMTTSPSISLKPVTVEDPKLDDISKLYNYLQQTESADQMIEIVEGDNLWKLSESHQISIDDIIKLNPDLDPELIHPGDMVRIVAADPLVDVQITLQNTLIESIPFETKTTKDASLYTSDRIIEKAGVEGSKEVVYEIKMLNGVQTELNVLFEKTLSEAITQEVRVGTQSTVMRDTGGNFGVTNGTFQSSFGYRTHPITGVKTFHAGIDISNQLNTPIYAYASGTVVSTEWEGALGNTITLDHGNGLVTKYAHLNAFEVSSGETVTAGQLIAKMGKTGYVTGVHLHFEVIKDGVYQNPLNYLN